MVGKGRILCHGGPDAIRPAAFNPLAREVSIKLWLKRNKETKERRINRMIS